MYKIISTAEPHWLEDKEIPFVFYSKNQSHNPNDIDGPVLFDPRITTKCTFGVAPCMACAILAFDKDGITIMAGLDHSTSVYEEESDSDPWASEKYNGNRIAYMLIKLGERVDVESLCVVMFSGHGASYSEHSHSTKEALALFRKVCPDKKVSLFNRLNIFKTPINKSIPETLEREVDKIGFSLDVEIKSVENKVCIFVHRNSSMMTYNEEEVRKQSEKS